MQNMDYYMRTRSRFVVCRTFALRVYNADMICSSTTSQLDRFALSSMSRCFTSPHYLIQINCSPGGGCETGSRTTRNSERRVSRPWEGIVTWRTTCGDNLREGQLHQDGRVHRVCCEYHLKNPFFNSRKWSMGCMGCTMILCAWN